MRQHQPGRATLTQQLAHDGNDGFERAPGRTTLVEQIGHDPRFAEASPVYRLDRASEPIADDEGVEAAEAGEGGANDRAGAGANAGVGEAPDGLAELRALGVEPRVEPSDATVPREGDAARAATGPAAHAANKGPHKMADEDEFNNAHITSHNKDKSGRQLNRPGVRFDTHKGKVDVLFPKKSVHRYLINERGEFVPHDMIHPNTPVAFNLAPLRSRGKATYALAFVNGRGSLWAPLSAFHDSDHVKEEIHDQSVHLLPSANVGPGAALYREFRPAGDSDGLESLADMYILPDKHGGANKLDHYRYRKGTHLYNVLLNLPQEAELGANEAPPVAVDSAQPGWAFFIARGGKFRRQVPVFHANSGVPGPFVTFVFGFLAKATRFGPQVDVRRRGWVPKGVLRKPVR